VSRPCWLVPCSVRPCNQSCGDKWVIMQQDSSSCGSYSGTQWGVSVVLFICLIVSTSPLYQHCLMMSPKMKTKFCQTTCTGGEISTFFSWTETSLREAFQKDKRPVSEERLRAMILRRVRWVCAVHQVVCMSCAMSSS
jgi:hypothetical protein